jgi:glycosyltransferase involved in cell wall biosynthesis
MAEKIYPKILIIGQSFNMNTGGGITISNLFRDWPKDRLAVASNVNLYEDLDLLVCENYYQLGYNCKLHPFPLNLFLPKIKCGNITLENKSKFVEEKREYAIKGKYKKIYIIITTILRFLGIYNMLYKLKITPEFKEWVTAYDPDVIYSQLSTLELIRFVSDIHDQFNKPIAVHIMDDWPNALNDTAFLFSYWEKVTDREFRKLLDKTSIFMSICETMSEEYKVRYNKKFLPFHNPVEIGNWLPFSKTDWTLKDKFTILYAGRIGRGIKNSIFDIARAVNNLNITNNNIVLEVQTNNYSEIKRLMKSNNNIKWLSHMEYNELPKKFSNVDLLVLPEDFDTASIEFLKYSIQTKVPEYMISGTPILVYADKQTALAKYALSDGWAYVVSECNEICLTQALQELYSNLSLRKQLAERAKQVALQNEDAAVIRENFRKNFILK